MGSRLLNRLGLHKLRVRTACGMTAWRRWLLAGLVAADDRAAFARQGYVVWADVLGPDAFARLREGLLERAWPAREMVQGHATTRRIAVDEAMLRAVPELGQLLRNPRWRGLMAYVSASKATPHYYVQTILTHRSDTDEADPQNVLHSDTFHPSMKAWLFLTDVAVEEGPLTYVSGSHRLTARRLDWQQRQAMAAVEGRADRLSERGSFRVGREDLVALDLQDPQPFAVPANTLVVADTFGFHARGPSARPSIRVELWAYSRRNPFLPWTGLNIGNVPAFVHRRITWFWALQDRYPKLFGRPLPPVGMKRPADP